MAIAIKSNQIKLKSKSNENLILVELEMNEIYNIASTCFLRSNGIFLQKEDVYGRCIVVENQIG